MNVDEPTTMIRGLTGDLPNKYLFGCLAAPALPSQSSRLTCGFIHAHPRPADDFSFFTAETSRDDGFVHAPSLNSTQVICFCNWT
jgi:hypothetical protein